MSDLIDTVQLQEVGEALIHLFELKLTDSVTLFAYSGLDEGTTPLFFPSTDGTAINEYVALPMDIQGVEWNSDGAASRPTLTVANLIAFSRTLSSDETSLGAELESLNIIKNEDILGSRLVFRRTLGKYLANSALDTPTSPIEFPVQTFVLDRVESENNMIVSFELASPFDVEGVKVPNRVVVGKYCPWKYKGVRDGLGGGCTWNPSTRFYDVNGNSVATETDDVCGKTIGDCKIRFQNGDTSIPLPFGGFPGTRKFK